MLANQVVLQDDLCQARILRSLYEDADLLGWQTRDWKDVAATDVFKIGTGLIVMEETCNLRFSFSAANMQMSHSLGMFTVDPITGNLGPVSMIWEDTSPHALTENTSLAVQAGELIGFVMVVDGFERNCFDDLDHGFFALVETNSNTLGLIHDDGVGTVTVIDGDVMVSTQAKTAVGYEVSHTSCVEIGFEDGWAMSRGQYNALVFQVDVGMKTSTAIAINQREGSFASIEEMVPNLKVVDGVWAKADQSKLPTTHQQTAIKRRKKARPIAKQGPPRKRVQPKVKPPEEAPDVFIYSSDPVGHSPKALNAINAQVDLTQTGLSFDQIRDRAVDLGWGKQIALGAGDHAGDVEKVIIRTPPGHDLSEEHFIL